MNRIRVLEDGSGRDRYMNGSNLTEEKLHCGQTSVDLYNPCTQCNDYFLQVLFLHIAAVCKTPLLWPLPSGGGPLKCSCLLRGRCNLSSATSSFDGQQISPSEGLPHQCLLPPNLHGPALICCGSAIMRHTLGCLMGWAEQSDQL